MNQMEFLALAMSNLILNLILKKKTDAKQAHVADLQFSVSDFLITKN